MGLIRSELFFFYMQGVISLACSKLFTELKGAELVSKLLREITKLQKKKKKKKNYKDFQDLFVCGVSLMSSQLFRNFKPSPNLR